MSKYIAIYTHRGYLNIDVRLPLKKIYNSFVDFFKTYQPVEE